MTVECGQFRSSLDNIQIDALESSDEVPEEVLSAMSEKEQRVAQGYFIDGRTAEELGIDPNEADKIANQVANLMRTGISRRKTMTKPPMATPSFTASPVQNMSPTEVVFEDLPQTDNTSFGEYLVAVTRGEKPLYSLAKYPKVITPGRFWTDTMNRIRKESDDGDERWLPLWTNRKDNKLHAPYKIQHSMPSLTVEDIEGETIIGEIVSRSSSWQRKIIHAITIGVRGENYGFLDQDFYRLLNPDSPFMIIIMVEVNKNLALLRSQETESLIKERVGFSFELWQKMINSLPEIQNTRFQLRDRNIALSKLFGLVLYEGKPGEKLVRIS